MYQAVGIPNFLRTILYINAALVAVLATNYWGWLPNMPIFRVVPLSGLAITVVLSILGQTPLFPYLCRIPVVWRIFPNLDGSYAVEIASNWPLIQAREQGHPQQTALIGDQLFKKSGTLTITARLFQVQIRLEMDDGYLTSDTIVCSIRKGAGESRPILSYIYQATVLEPHTTDSSRHYGAARIEVPNQRAIDLMEGIYWTDRNWHQARNTAGHIRLRRRKRSRRAVRTR